MYVAHKAASAPTVGDLTNQTMTRVRSYFEARTSHRPSPEMYSALTAVAETLAKMAVGQPAQTIYLSSLDPGIGKTTVYTKFLDALLLAPSLADVGVLILVSRLDEVRSLVEQGTIPASMLSVLTSDPDLNGCGLVPANDAQVLITTQQGLEKRLRNQPFEQCSSLFYQGAPRRVRIWDESWLPGDGITLRRYDLSDVLKSLVWVNRRMADAVEDLFIEIKSLADDSKVSIPDWHDEYGIDLNTAISVLDDPKDNADARYKAEKALILAHLFAISGKTVTVRQDGMEGNTAVTYRETLPQDLAPLLVLDASGRVRHTYSVMEERRKNITRLPAAVKTYEPLKVHVWRTGGGKSAFRDLERAQELIEGITKTVLTKPREHWLIVHHKPSRDLPDIPKLVTKALAGRVTPEMVHFLSWGNHAATNQYAGVKNVVLAGTLFFRPSQYEALGRLAARHPDTEKYSLEERKAIETGEHAHGILQALCRAAVRQCRGSQCAPSDAWIIASARSGIEGQLETVFPGCQVDEWRPVRRALQGKVAQAVEYLNYRFREPRVDFVAFKDVMKAVGILKPSDFQTLIRRSQQFKAEMAEMGLVEWGPKARFTGFKRYGKPVRTSAADYGFTKEMTSK